MATIRPSRMIEVLKAADAWPELMPEFESPPDRSAIGLPAPDLVALDRAAAADAPLLVAEEEEI